MKIINLIKKRSVSIVEIKKHRKKFLVIFFILNLIFLIFILRLFLISSQLEKALYEYNNLENSINESKKNINTQELLFFKEFSSKTDKISNIIKNKKYLSYMLYIIAEFLPEEVYLDNLEVKQKDVRIQVYVYPKKDGGEVEIINEFITKLERTEFFLTGKTQINSQGSGELEGKEMLVFQISLKLA